MFLRPTRVRRARRRRPRRRRRRQTAHRNEYPQHVLSLYMYLLSIRTYVHTQVEHMICSSAPRAPVEHGGGGHGGGGGAELRAEKSIFSTSSVYVCMYLSTYRYVHMYIYN